MLKVWNSNATGSESWCTAGWYWFRKRHFFCQKKNKQAKKVLFLSKKKKTLLQQEFSFQNAVILSIKYYFGHAAKKSSNHYTTLAFLHHFKPKFGDRRKSWSTKYNYCNSLLNVSKTNWSQMYTTVCTCNNYLSWYCYSIRIIPNVGKRFLSQCEFLIKIKDSYFLGCCLRPPSFALVNQWQRDFTRGKYIWVQYNRIKWT